MIRESEFQRIVRKTGRKPSNCKCQDCKSQCMKCVCLGTPSDIEAIIDAGHGANIYLTSWAAGILVGTTDKIIDMYQALQTSNGCVFFKDGLCSLHDKGLKPTEGRLSHHEIKKDNYQRGKSITFHVAKTWLDPDNSEVIERIEKKLQGNYYALP